MTIRAHFDGVHQPGVRTHGRPAHRDQAHPRLRQDARRISRAVAANNYSPLPLTAAPRRADQTHPPSPLRTRGGSGGWAASERARARHPGGRRAARAIQRTSLVWRHTPRSIRAPARSEGASAGRLSMRNPSPVATLPRRSQESRPSHRRADADDDGRARRRSCRVNSGARACAAPPVRDDGQHTWRRRPQASVSESGTCAPPQSPPRAGGFGGCDAPDVPSACQSRRKRR